MTFPEHLRRVLPPATRRAWEAIVPGLPEGAYLVGGTAIAAHLGHRESRDLDVFTTVPFDPHTVDAALGRIGAFQRTSIDEGTLNGVYEATKIQVLDASAQALLEPPTTIAGLAVAGLGDLLATKLKVIGDRGELRDYLDFQLIEQLGHRRVEEVIGLYLARYRPEDPDPAVSHLVAALGYFGDVADDPFLPVAREEIVRFWRRRQPEVVAHLDRWGLSPPAGSVADERIVEGLHDDERDG